MIIPDVLLSPFALNGDRNVIPQEDSSGFINFNDGYTPFYEISLTANNPQAKAVERQGMNELFFQMSQNAMAWQQMSTAPWLSGTAGGYMTNAQVARLGNDGTARIYRSVIDNNTSDPSTNSSQWELQPSWSAMRGNIPMPAGGRAALDPSSELLTSTSGLDANNLLTGTWEFATDAAAQACANMPTLFGTNAVRGMFEGKSWTVGNQTVAIQRYTSVDGRQFLRGNNGVQWSAWNFVLIPSDVQTDITKFTGISLVQGSTSAYQGSLTPAPGTFRAGQTIIAYSNTPNVGAATLSLNGGTAYPIVTESIQPLSGNELIAGTVLMWETNANFSRWRIVTGMGVKSQSAQATADTHLPTFLQVKNMISAQGKPQWADVQNKPSVVINGDPGANLQSLSLSPAATNATFLDFYYPKVTVPSARLVNNLDGRLSIILPSTSQSIISGYFDVAGFHSDAGISTSSVLKLTGGVNSAIYWTAPSGSINWLIGDNGQGGLDFNAYNGTVGATAMRIANTGQVTFFAGRPAFATGTPWDTGNFNPALYRAITNGTFNTQIQAVGGLAMPATINILWTDAGNTIVRFYMASDDNNLRWNARGDDTDRNIMTVARSTGTATFGTRPSFAGQTPWDTGNFNPAAYAVLGAINNNWIGGFSNTAAISTLSGQAGGFRTSTGASQPNLSASINFLRDSYFGVYLGLDTDNVMKIGGWSMGQVAYPILHTGNLAVNIGAALAANNYNAVGQYGMFIASGGATGVPLAPGALISGSQLSYCSAGAAPAAVFPPGTWQACCQLFDYDGQAQNSIGIFRRIS